MADILKCQSAVTFTRETPAETVRLIDKYTQQEPTSFQQGEVTVAPSTVDLEIATDANVFYLFTDDNPVSLKVDNTTATEMTNMRAFSYNGSATNVFISNPDAAESVKVYFISAKII